MISLIEFESIDPEISADAMIKLIADKTGLSEIEVMGHFLAGTLDQFLEELND